MPAHTTETLFIGKGFHHRADIDSTNLELARMLTSRPLPEGTVVRAGHQSRGKGQLGRSWKGAPGMNLYLSVLLYPRFLSLSKHFLFNMAIGLAQLDCLSRFLPEADLRLKWPNDLLANDHKIAGTLIQNTWQQQKWKHSIVGIGLNVNQPAFPEDLPRATSMYKIAGKPFSLEQVMRTLFVCLEHRYLALKNGQYPTLFADYQSALYQKEQLASLRDEAGRNFRATIEGVNLNGKLQVRMPHGESHLPV